MNPYFEREWRNRFRLRTTYIWLLLLTGFVAWMIVARYSSWLNRAGEFSGPNINNGQIYGLLGADLFTFLAPTQIALALLIAPSLTASTLAYERERGTLDLLLLTRLSPWQIAFGRWFSALAFAFLLLLALWPINMLILLLGGVGPGQVRVALALTVVAAIFGTSLGIGLSAWGRRAHHTLRSANGIVTGWLLVSAIAALLSGEWFSIPTIISFEPVTWLGRTNPVLAVLELSSWQVGAEKWPYAISFMLISSILALWCAKLGLSKVQDDAPIVELTGKNTQKSGKAASSTFEFPVLAHWRLNNPIFGREIRAKFRVRKPPLFVVVAEALLALLVAAFYVWVFYQALTNPRARYIIFLGVYFTGLVVTLMSVAVLGASAFSREREGGTWESLKLATLSASEIITGKVAAIFLTPLLFSLPVWPLLLACIAWSGDNTLPYYSRFNGVLPTQFLSVIIIWLGAIWGMTALALWVGLRFSKTATATSSALGVGALWTVVLPFLCLWIFEARQFLPHSFEEKILSLVSPFSAFVVSRGSANWFETGIPFLLVTLIWGSLLLWHTHNKVRRELENDLPVKG